MSKPSIKLGDVIELGEHRLICGDATNPEHVNKLIGNQKIDLILTDVPYGVGYVESKKGFVASTQNHKVIANDHLQTEGEFQEFSEQWLGAVKTSMAPKNSFYIFNSDKMMFPLRNAVDAEGFRFTQTLIWVKTGAVIGRLHYLPQHESIMYGWYGTHAFHNSQDKSVLIQPKPKKNNLHPTMKPLPLLRRLILNSSKIGQTVYDPFGGSGSTLIASENTKRQCLMMELDPEYCQVIVDRWKQHAQASNQKTN